MSKHNIKLFLFFIIGLGTAFLVMYFFQNYLIEKKNKEKPNSEVAATSHNQDEIGFPISKTTKH